MKNKLIGGVMLVIGVLVGLMGVWKLIVHLTVMADSPLQGEAAASQLGGALIGVALVAVAYFAGTGGMRRIRLPVKPQS